MNSKLRIITITVILVFSLTITSFADDLRKTNEGDNCIKYGTSTWTPKSKASGWYKYNINGNEVSARGGTHWLDDAQAKSYGLVSSGGSSSSSSKYKQKEIAIGTVNIKPEKKSKVTAKVATKKTKNASVKVNGNKSGFTKNQITKAKKLNKEKGWIALSAIDSKKRAKRAITLINDNTLPTEKRKALKYNPPGWKSKKAKIKGSNIYFYNRSHLIAFSLSGYNDDARNLITGAVKMNTPTMSKIENSVAKYVKDTDNAVLYEVTPYYKGSENVARGVQIRYKSIDLGKKDNKKIEKNVYLYNANPGWKINYKTGSFKKAK